MVWRCGGNPKTPKWVSDPDTMPCVSSWIRDSDAAVDRLVSSFPKCDLIKSKRVLYETLKHNSVCKIRKFVILTCIIFKVALIQAPNFTVARVSLKLISFKFYRSFFHLDHVLGKTPNDGKRAFIFRGVKFSVS